MVDIETNGNSLGFMRFFLDRGEPGDSGTLLCLKKNEGWVPRAIFTGIEPPRPGFGRRGLAATLPDREQFHSFPILDLGAAEHSQLTSLKLVDWDSQNEQARHGTVTIDKKDRNAVDCVYEGIVVAHGVIVKSNLNKTIGYVGQKDYFKMMGIGI